MTSTMTPETLASLTKIQASLAKPFKPEPDPRLRDDEPWTPQLQRLPKTCELWRLYLAYNKTRVAYEDARATHQRWLDGLVRINQLLEIDDPEVADASAWAANWARGKMYEFALKNQAEAINEAKHFAFLGGERWGTTWEAYRLTKNYLTSHDQQALMPRAWGDVMGMVEPSDVVEKRQYIAQMEYPQV